MPGQEFETAKAGRSRWLYVRWTLATVIAVIGVAMVLASFTPDGWQVCSDQVLQAQGRVISECRPVAPTDAVVLVPLALVVLLLLPDFSEVAIPGLVSLKRRVAQQETRQDRLEAALVDVSQSVSQQAQQHVTVQPIFVSDIRQAVATAGRKSAALREGAVPIPDAEVAEPAVTPPPPDRAMREAELIRLGEVLFRWDQRAQTLLLAQDSGFTLAARPWGADPERANELLAWRRTFRRELDVVRATRNAVAHAADLDDEALNDAVELARSLVASLEDTLGRRFARAHPQT